MSLAEEMHGYYLEDLSVGMTAVFGKTVTEADIQAFAGVSGDTNPLHLHDEFARSTMFKGRIAHGMLSASFISTVVGTRLPGPGAVYVSQTLNRRPTSLRIGSPPWTGSARGADDRVSAPRCQKTSEGPIRPAQSSSEAIACRIIRVWMSSSPEVGRSASDWGHAEGPRLARLAW